MTSTYNNGMVLLMYWEDDSEEKRKLRREERLRAKKKGTEVVDPPVEQAPPPPSNDLSIDKILEVLSKQTALSMDQSNKIDELSKIIIEQQKVIQEIKENGPTVVKIEKDVEEKQEKQKVTKLDDIDVNIIDTTGIETVGEASGEITKGSSIKDQLAKLKRLRKQGD